MSGIASFMTSPSARTTKRSTPCVDGCCGPMLSVMSSVARPPPGVSRWTSTSKPASPISSPSALQEAFARRGDAVVLLGLDEVLPERVPRPVLRHEDAAEVRMALEADAEEVEDLALFPFRVCPHAGEAREHGVVARRIGLQHELMPMPVGPQVVDDLDDLALRVVDAGE